MLPDYVDAQHIKALREKFERRLDRERRARSEAEDLLEAKSRELYTTNTKLKCLTEELEQRVELRTRELALAERRALALAERDQLTEIANRTVFSRAVEDAISKGVDFAVLLIDLDNFKDVNDSLGHDVGDALLRHAAGRIADVIENSDLVARLGGDEFAVLVLETTSPAALTSTAKRILSAIREPLRHRCHSVEVSCSVGIAIFPDHGADAGDIQRFADLALYRAKAAGGKEYCIFDDGLRRDYDDRHAIGSELKLAIKTGQLDPWFQPIIDSRTGKLSGVEALARWQHPTRGLLLPGKFLGIAEDQGLIHDLFSTMLQQTCRKTLDWIRSGSISFASVNVSPNQFRTGLFVETVNRVIRAEGFPPSALTVEITEEALLNDLGSAKAQLEELALTGVRVSLDDFGIGYSNIGYLRRLPLHQIKLDRVLTADIALDAKARTILSAIIEIARCLELKVVAEGVETNAQAEWLSQLGCDKLQGFYFGRAMQGNLIQERLQQQMATVQNRSRFAFEHNAV